MPFLETIILFFVIISNINEHLLYARNYSKCFTCLKSFDFHKKTYNEGAIIILILNKKTLGHRKVN